MWSAAIILRMGLNDFTERFEVGGVDSDGQMLRDTLAIVPPRFGLCHNTIFSSLCGLFLFTSTFTRKPKIEYSLTTIRRKFVSPISVFTHGVIPVKGRHRSSCSCGSPQRQARTC